MTPEERDVRIEANDELLSIHERRLTELTANFNLLEEEVKVNKKQAEDMVNELRETMKIIESNVTSVLDAKSTELIVIDNLVREIRKISTDSIRTAIERREQVDHLNKRFGKLGIDGVDDQK